MSLRWYDRLSHWVWVAIIVAAVALVSWRSAGKMLAGWMGRLESASREISE